MSYKNSIKLLTTNFGLVWKQLLYMLIIVLCSFGLTCAFGSPVVNLLKQEGIVQELLSIFDAIYTSPKDILSAISTLWTHFYNVISTNFSSLWFNFVGIFFTGYFAFDILKSISMYNLSSIMYLKNTSNVEIGYTKNLISTLGQSIRYAFVKFVIDLPFTAVKVLAISLFLTTVNSLFTILIGSFLLATIIILISSAQISVFSGMATKMIETNGNISAFKAFGKGAVVSLKKFNRIFSNAIIVILSIIFVDFLLGLFTLGAGLLISVPASMLFIAIFSQIAYFGAKGERYYLTSTTIVNPLNDDGTSLK